MSRYEAVRTETEIQKAILQYLKSMGIFAWRNNTFHVAGRKGVAMKGVPDIIGVLGDGRALFIEVKTPEAMKKKGGLSKDQKKFLAEAIKRGALAFVATSVEDVELMNVCSMGD